MVSVAQIDLTLNSSWVFVYANLFSRKDENGGVLFILHDNDLNSLNEGIQIIVILN